MPRRLLGSSHRLSWLCLAGVIFLFSPLAGFSLPRLFKSDDPKKFIDTTIRNDPQTGKLTQAGLQAEVMSFADEYVLTLRQAMDVTAEPQTVAVH